MTDPLHPVARIFLKTCKSELKEFGYRFYDIRIEDVFFRLDFPHFLFFSGWVTLTFFGESVRMVTSKDTNETLTEVVPRLPIKAWYPFDAMSGSMYIFAFVFQVHSLIYIIFDVTYNEVT